MTASEDALRRAAAMFHRRFVLWWRPRNSTRWRRVGDFPSVVAAGVEMERRMQRGDGGDWKALVQGRSPTEVDRDDDDDETREPLSPARRAGA